MTDTLDAPAAARGYLALADEADAAGERLTQRTNSPLDGLLIACADAIRALVGEPAADTLNAPALPANVYLLLLTYPPIVHSWSESGVQRSRIRKVLGAYGAKDQAEQAREAIVEKFHEDFPGYRRYKEEPLDRWEIMELPLAARSTTPSPAASGWLPIESAPKDGRTLLLGCFNQLGKWRTMRGQWMSEDYIAENWEYPENGEPGWFETCVEAGDPPNCWPIAPTHWQPLPAAPVSPNTAGGERHRPMTLAELDREMDADSYEIDGMSE